MGNVVDIRSPYPLVTTNTNGTKWSDSPANKVDPAAQTYSRSDSIRGLCDVYAHKRDRSTCRDVYLALGEVDNFGGTIGQALEGETRRTRHCKQRL